ncbi:cupin domain-containing protein [Methanocaldococcus infernus]|uniref:Cupin 2 conserved barrel domain protein n=1 Tax=Methanocaldococcus infernus (strain DSM 11812 / JCM 15783 / ME) TaxID=573063 RepID=D5VRZ0_METIM|nr:cupin domain-containing protein [Methanocaldococcus infernus]ADG13343.1 Cupin 2 conserved barrel domain protein [Methanocaldococcus infernus ME]
MIEKVYNFTTNANKKLIEKIVNTEHVIINHMVLPKGEKIPKHISNSYVHLIIIKGEMTLTLEDQEPNLYKEGSIVYVPFNTKMLIENKTSDLLEFFVIKAPHPKKLGAPEEAIKCE